MIRPTLALTLLLAAPAQAQSNHADLAAIDRAVAQFTGAGQGQPGGAILPLDRRLRLAPCPAALALGWYGGKQDTVEVVCPAPGGWKLYVPLVGSGKAAAGVTSTPAVSAYAVTRGDAVTITVRGEGFAVSQPGQALESGALGAWIKVRGVAQGAQVLRARVLRPGLVGMELP
jgi:flagellar basal body P-ring formation protein FlgA